MPDLFGDDFKIQIKKPTVKKTVSKSKTTKTAEVETAKLLKSKKLTLEERLAVIKEKVYKTLGKHIDNVIVIKTKAEFEDYITKAIASGKIAIDTETNNSLDPVTCKLMGPCLYYEGGKQAYVPINHTDLQGNRLDWQLTEEDCREQFKRINDSGILRIFHNGKFDYEVIKCTCGIEVVPDWDTMICARLLNENERAALKEQYITKVDRTQAKYDIENLFDHIAYNYVDPTIFALYAATDAFLTYRLYELQETELAKPEYGPHLDLRGVHMLKGLRWVFHEVEMPIVQVTAEMELAGVEVDTELGARLKLKYEKLLNEIDSQISQKLNGISVLIKKWRLSDAANARVKSYVAKKTKMTQEKILVQYPYEDTYGRYKLGKAKTEVLEDTINLASPSQLAVLFYDVLEVPAPSETSRKTGKDELKYIKETLAAYLPKLDELWIDEEDLDQEAEESLELSTEQETALKLGTAAQLADLILKRRGIAKLVTTYIDVIPELVKHWPDGRIRFHLNSLGTDTGRYSSGGKLKFMENGTPIEVSGINIQNIPSHNAEIRLLFKAKTENHVVALSDTDNYYCIPEIDEVETTAGWKAVKDIVVGDTIIGDDNVDVISNIKKVDRNYYLYVS